jgi:predicted secreted Zn-dependent protease
MRDTEPEAWRHIRSGLLRAWCATGVAFMSLGAHAEVVEQLDYAYYPVNATPSLSLREAINAASPIRENGQIFHGLTRWNVSWRIRWWEEADGRCRIISATVTLQSRITLPRLSGANAPQQTTFDSYIKALRIHELGHHQIGVDAARAVENAILSQPEAPRCTVLEERVNAAGRAKLNEYGPKNVEYDRQTSYGKTQGAWLRQ